MRKFIFLLFGVLAFSFSSYSQANEYNLASKNLHKKVAKTIEHYYTYHERSGGFVKVSVTINTHNDKGDLAEKYYQYNSTYSGQTSTTETMYHYNAKDQLTRTEDISAKKSSYSSHYQYHYDNKGNLTKKETIYSSGNNYKYNYFYDNRDRLTRYESYDSKGNLTSRESYTYSGNQKTKVRKSYDTKTGNVSGTYTTYFKNDQSQRYVSQSKYSNNDVTYQYDKNNNLVASVYKGKPDSGAKYAYEYDNRGNWVKKYYKYGKSTNSFYFREVIFKNGSSTGSVDFDKNFINRNGNYSNVNIVPIVKYSSDKKTTTTYTDPKMPVFKNKNFVFNYVNLDKKVSSVNGEVTISVVDNDKMSKNSTVRISYDLGGKTYSDTYNVVSSMDLPNKGYYFWSLKSKTKSTKVSFTMQHKKRYFESRDMYLAGMLNITFNNKSTGFYLEE